jgi:hypothetical protein
VLLLVEGEELGVVLANRNQQATNGAGVGHSRDGIGPRTSSQGEGKNAQSGSDDDGYNLPPNGVRGNRSSIGVRNNTCSDEPSLSAQAVASLRADLFMTKPCQPTKVQVVVEKALSRRADAEATAF